jgi:hypothetical protein
MKKVASREGFRVGGSRRPPISLDVIEARTHLCTYAANVWDSPLAQGPFLAPPVPNPWRCDSLLPSLCGGRYLHAHRRGGGGSAVQSRARALQLSLLLLRRSRYAHAQRRPARAARPSTSARRRSHARVRSGAARSHPRGGPVLQRCKSRESYDRDFGWEIAHGAVTRRPPISLYAMAARTRGYAYDDGT